MKIIGKYSKIICWAVILSFSGCVSVKVDYVEPEKLKQHNVYRIAVIYMKEGKVYDMHGIEAKLHSQYKGLTNVIVFTVPEGETEIISISEISKLKIIIMENDAVKTSLIIAGSLILATLIFMMFVFPVGEFNITG